MEAATTHRPSSMENSRGDQMKELLELLNNVRSDVDFENENHLVDDGILDSFDIVSIIADVNDEFNVEITVDDILPENFNSAKALHDLIERLKDR